MLGFWEDIAALNEHSVNIKDESRRPVWLVARYVSKMPGRQAGWLLRLQSIAMQRLATTGFTAHWAVLNGIALDVPGAASVV